MLDWGCKPMQTFESYVLRPTPEQVVLLTGLAAAQVQGLRGALPRAARRMLSPWQPNIPEGSVAYRVDKSGWRVLSVREKRAGKRGLFVTVRKPYEPGRPGYAEAHRIYIESELDIRFAPGYTRGRLWIVRNASGAWSATVWRHKIGKRLDFPHPAGGPKRRRTKRL
jgi:hypothetical protein